MQMQRYLPQQHPGSHDCKRQAVCGYNIMKTEEKALCESKVGILLICKILVFWKVSFILQPLPALYHTWALVTPEPRHCICRTKDSTSPNISVVMEKLKDQNTRTKQEAKHPTKPLPDWKVYLNQQIPERVKFCVSICISTDCRREKRGKEVVPKLDTRHQYFWHKLTPS